MAAPAVLAGIARVKQILSVKVPQGGGASASSPQIQAPTFGGGPAAMAVPQVQTGGGMNPTQQIAETINQSQKPVRAYVVSQDISSQQALDRRTNVAATFG